ncbi:MAG: N-acetyltransferase [Gammaproteobacteria bacterium]|nr:MAG: N-acetyltransferase [Gammaproteobacteria bacterium]
MHRTAKLATSPDALRIEVVSNNKQLRQFIALPTSLYQDDPNWIQPLNFEQKQRLSPGKNPFFEHARARLWIAYRGTRAVGRISAQIDELHQQRYHDGVGYFGMLEAENEPALVSALLVTAEGWLRENQMTTARGPFNLGINEECGLLVKGFDTPPRIMMGHARPYYAAAIEAADYSKIRTLLAYHMDPDFILTPVMLRLMSSAQKSVTVRPFNRREADRDLEIMRDIFNDAWENNWRFVPFTEAEFADVGKLLTALIDEDFVAIAEMDGRPVAMIVALPDINQVSRDLNGRLLPFGWLKLLWRLKVTFPTQARVPLMGVRKEFHNTRMGPGLAFMVIDSVRVALRRKGVNSLEMSWILENNAAMCNIIENIGGVAYKHYNIYEKAL